MLTVSVSTITSIRSGGLYAELVQGRSFDYLASMGPNVTSFVSLLQSVVSVSLSIHCHVSQGSDLFLRHCDYIGYTSAISSSLDKSESRFCVLLTFSLAELIRRSRKYQL